MDLDGTSTGSAPGRSRKAARPQKTPQSGQVVTLSLKDIPMPPVAADVGGSAAGGPAEAGTEEAAQAAVPGKEPAKTPAVGSGGAAQVTPPSVAAPDPNAPPPRNLFAFEEDPQVVMSRRQLAEEAAAQAEESRRKSEEARLKWQGPPLPPPPPQPPSISFQFIGYMGTPEDRIGVFSGPGTFLAKNGEVVQGKFKILSIGYESAEIGFTGFSQTQRIPLTPGGK
jgi:hypothetical protein